MARKQATEVEEPTPRKRQASRKPGLLHPSRAVEIQEVRKAMRLCCSACEVAPVERRLVVRTGAGRYAKQEVFCAPCGLDWLQAREREYVRAQTYLFRGVIPTAPGEREDQIRL